MTFVEQVSADLVVACWLKAELSSPRFRPRVVKALKHFRVPLRAVERPNVTSRRENLLRRAALQSYRKDTWGILPQDTQWWRAAITSHEFRRLRVINYPTWTLLSCNTGRLSVAAVVVTRETVPPKARGRWPQEARAVITHVREIRDRLKGAEIQSQLIVMGRPGGKTWTIVEGNKRATALYIRCFLTKTEVVPRSFQVLLGLTAQPLSCLRTA
jgi:hypothetical protein